MATSLEERSKHTQTIAQTEEKNAPEKNPLPWKVFYMSVAELESQRSNCGDAERVGACIVSPMKKIVAVGHHRKYCKTADDQTASTDQEDLERGMKGADLDFVSYAAIDAILNKSAESLDGCTMYMTKCPRTEEAKLIIQVGIKEVIYFHKDESPSYKWAEQLLYYAGVRPTWYGDTPISRKYPSIEVDVFPDTSVPRRTPKERPPNHPDCNDDMNYFMAMACLVSLRSKDPTRQVGACLVDKKDKIVGFGYNGFPLHIDDEDPRVSWDKKEKQKSVVHAEVNALMFRNCLDLEGCTLYTTLFPCLDCAKTIIRSGIKKLYYLTDPVDDSGESEWDDQEMDEAWKKLHKDKPTFLASRHLLQEYNYKSNPKESDNRCCKQYRPSKVFKVELQRQVIE